MFSFGTSQRQQQQQQHQQQQQQHQQQQQQQQQQPANTSVATTSLETALSGVIPFITQVLEINGWISLLDNFLWSSGNEYLDEFREAFGGKFLGAISRPLSHPPRNAQHKSIIENQDRTKVDVVEVLRLADELDLDEKEALNLWTSADPLKRKGLEKQLGISFAKGISVYKCAVSLLFWKREALLNLISRLIRLRNPLEKSASLSEEKIDAVRMVTDKLLIENNFAITLMDTVTTHNARILKLLSPQHRGLPGRLIQLQAMRNERCKLCESIYMIFFGTLPVDKECLALVKLIRDVSNRLLDSQDTTTENQTEATSSYEALYYLLMTLGAVLDRSEELYDRTLGKFVVKRVTEQDRSWLELMDTAFRSEVPQQQSLSNVSSTTSIAQWRHDGVLGCCLLFWGAFLGDLLPQDFPNLPLASKDHRTSIINIGLEKRGVAFLTGVVRSPEFIYDELRRVHVGIIDALCARLAIIWVDSRQINGDDRIEQAVEEILYPRSQLLENHRYAATAQHPQQQHHHHLHHHHHSTSGSHGTAVEEKLIHNAQAIPDSLEDFLSLLRILHGLQPGLGDKFWQLGTFTSFVDEVRRISEQSNDPQSLYVSFLQFLASLAGTEQAALQLISYLGSGGEISWHRFLSALNYHQKHLASPNLLQQQQQQQYYGSMAYSQHVQGNPVTMIPFADQLVLCCWLRVLNAALCSPTCTQRFIESCLSSQSNPSAFGASNPSSTTMSHIDVCLSLLHFDLETALKSQLTMVVVKLAPFVNAEAWSLVEQHQLTLLVKSDLDQKESIQHSYPFTTGFLDLILTLITHVDSKQYRYLGNNGQNQPSQQTPQPPPPHQQGQQHNHHQQNGEGTNLCSGILPFLDFVLYEVFLKIDQRKYTPKGEKWHVAASCLRIFSEILNRYTERGEQAQSDFGYGRDVSGNDSSWSFSAGFWVMAKILEGSNFYKQLINIIKDAGGECGVRMKREKFDEGGISDIMMEDSSSNMLSPTPMQSSSQFQQQQTPFGVANNSLSQQQQMQQLLLQQQQSGPSNGGSLEKKWFMVASRRSNLDIRNSSILQGESTTSNYSHGMIRVRHKAVTAHHSYYDGGKFASWLVQPTIYGWNKAFQPKYSSQQQQQQQFADPQQVDSRLQEVIQLAEYEWDDGDIGGLWREYSVRLALKLLTSVSAKEGWFFDGVHASDPNLEGRLERLHRLFAHRRERLLCVSGFIRYPFSAEMRLNSIELLFRLASQGPAGTNPGSIVQVLRHEEKQMKENLALCLLDDLDSIDIDHGHHVMNDNDDEDVDLVQPTAMSPYGFDPNISKLDLKSEAISRRHIHKRILELLVQGISQPQGNLTELVLGLRPIAAREAELDTINLLPGSKDSALNIVLDILDDPTHIWHLDAELEELMYRLVFEMCDNKFTGFAMSYGLNVQRSRFWLRHFKEIVSKSNLAASNSKRTKSMAWVVNGVGVDLRVAYSGSFPGVSSRDLLPTLFTVDSIRDVDQTHLRILEVLDAISLEGIQPESQQPPEAYKHLQDYYKQHYRGPNFISPFASFNGLTYYKLDIGQMKRIYIEMKSYNKGGRNQQQQQRNVGDDEAWEEVERWSQAWNSAQDEVSARAHLICAWKDIVKLSVVDCREDLIKTCCSNNSFMYDNNDIQSSTTSAGNEGNSTAVVVAGDRSQQQQQNNFRGGDEYLLRQLIGSIIRKLIKFPGGSTLVDPLASLVVILIAQLRYGDDDEYNNGQLSDLAIAAATGRFCMQFSSVKLNLSIGLARLSREENQQLIEGILEAFRKTPTTNQGGTTVLSPEMRGSMFAALLNLLEGSRTLYANALGSMGPVRRQTPYSVTEIDFLSATVNLGNDDHIQELRGRAIASLESIHGNERGAGLLQMAAHDAMDSKNASTRLIALSMVKVLLECDREDDRWHNSLRRNGFFRQLLHLVVDRVRKDQLYASADVDRIYTLSISVLCTMTTRSKGGALSLIQSGFLSSLQDGPLMVLCDKRALDAWVATGTSSSAPKQQDLDPHSTQEQRHDIVLPLLRLIQNVFISVRRHGTENEISRFQHEVLGFFRQQKRMVSSALGFPPSSLDDIKESILIISVLTNCAKSNGAKYIQELGGATASEFDSLVFDLIQELCPSEWNGRIVPYSAYDVDRARIQVAAPPDMMASNGSTNLFQLDVFSQQRRLLQHAIAYCRARNKLGNVGKENSTRHETFIHSLVLCLDYSSRSLAAIARASSSAFHQALVEKKSGEVNTSVPTSFEEDEEWSQSIDYVSWSCSTLFFVLEGALSVLYYKLKNISAVLRLQQKEMPNQSSTNSSSKRVGDEDAIKKWLRHSKMLVNYYDPTQEKSPLEQLEEVIRMNTPFSQFIHLILRRIREL